MSNLCQGCVLLPPEKQLHIPHENDTLEKDIDVCRLCYDRISEALQDDTDIDVSVIGSRILGVRTKSSETCDY